MPDAQTGQDVAPGSVAANKVLVVDDEPMVLNAVRRALRREGFDVTTVGSGGEALTALARESFAALITDQRMPIMDGLTVLEKARQISPDTVRVMLTGLVESSTAIDAINRGEVSHFLTKPWRDADLRHALTDAVGQHHTAVNSRRFQELTQQENLELRNTNDGLERVRRQESQAAGRIQKSVLVGRCDPRYAASMEVATLTLPSGDVDGDFVDFYGYGSDCLDLVLGDVMGKGVPAALLGAAATSHLMRAANHLLAAAGRLPRPQDIVALVHASMTPKLIQLESFLTLWYGRIDLSRKRLVYVSAGHPRPILHGAQETRLLDTENLPLGVSVAERYAEREVTFEPGQSLVVYSDGVTETRGGADFEDFGEARLLQLVTTAGRDPRAVVAGLRAGLREHAGPGHYADDVTCVAISLLEGEAA